MIFIMVFAFFVSAPAALLPLRYRGFGGQDGRKAKRKSYE